MSIICQCTMSFWTSTPRSRHLSKKIYIRTTSFSCTNRAHQSSYDQKPSLAWPASNVHFAVWFLFNLLRLKLEFSLPTPRLATTCWAKQSTEFFCSSRFHEEIRHGWFIPFFFLFQLGYNRSEIEESLRTSKFDDCYASYLLLGRKPSDVSQLFLQYKTV